ncbi:GNAT family N-acetyltransferase [Corynebacterium mendelii]|uniref:GNAT family N-acetyltransferase n=1 Tax=Corynebacterium mendelii TaxID=2765362 RepID=A0A939E1I2_9CORY|nr:GNAT family protein [Corynebacterium mendelii]MBN9644983.1 GNAT family N-acetyltransferase [Corynebacterium mendelii]
MANPLIDPELTLNGRFVDLVPLSRSHAPALAVAVDDGGLYRQWWTSTPDPRHMAADIRQKLARGATGEMVAFAIIDTATSTPCGVTAFYAIDPTVPRVSIGYTWLRKSLWGGPINPEMKYLMMAHAFERAGCKAVEIRTKKTNRHSRGAIEKLGLSLDGIIRNTVRLRNGRIDDSYVYTATDQQWPGIKAGLDRRLAGFTAG